MLLAFYLNIPHGEGLASLRKHLDNRQNKEVTTDTLVELADIVLKTNYFRGTAIGTKFNPPYSILFIADLYEEVYR